MRAPLSDLLKLFNGSDPAKDLANGDGHIAVLRTTFRAIRDGLKEAMRPETAEEREARQREEARIKIQREQEEARILAERIARLKNSMALSDRLEADSLGKRLEELSANANRRAA